MQLKYWIIFGRSCKITLHNGKINVKYKPRNICKIKHLREKQNWKISLQITTVLWRNYD